MARRAELRALVPVQHEPRVTLGNEALSRLALAALLPAFAGCSTASSLALGPAASYVPDRPTTYGAEGLARSVIGESNGTSFAGFESAARFLATSDRQLLGGGFGPAWFGSFGRGLISLEGTPMLAFEHVPGSVLTVGTLRGALGFGYAFEKSSATSHQSMPWMIPGFATEITKTTALTLELTGALDAPVTRGVEYSVGVLLGIAWLEQRRSVELPAPWQLQRMPIVLVKPPAP